MSVPYTFLNAIAGYTDSLGNMLDFSAGNGVAEEGMTIEWDEDKVSITRGADGDWMYNLHAASGGIFTIRALRTSPLNYYLSNIYTKTTAGGATVGTGIITGGDVQRGESFNCVGCQIRRHSAFTSAKEGPGLEWVFLVGKLSAKLGIGTPALPINGGI